MKLTTRRTIRSWFLGAPTGTVIGMYLVAAGVVGLGFVTDADLVVLAGFGAGVGLLYVRNMAENDACPNCRSPVRALSDRYCYVCGTRLDEIPSAPPIDERVDERHRPVGLNEIERSPAPEAIADGGESNDEEGSR